MSDSSLVTYKNITNDRNSPRNHKIDTITIHCWVGQVTAKQGCDYFKTSDRQVSSNYVVGKDGSIGLSVPEADRAWTSSSPTNDNRAVTIEVASDTNAPYRVTDAAYKALIKLVTDICKRNGIKKLVWSGNKNTRINHLNGANMTVHRDFANTACPGEYLYSKMPEIASKVNSNLGAASPVSTTASKQFTSDEYFKKGDKSLGVYAIKRMLIALKAKGIIKQSVDDNNIFGDGTVTAIKQAQKAAGVEVDGYVGPITIRALVSLLTK